MYLWPSKQEYDIHGVWPVPEVDDIPISGMPGGSYFRSYPRQRPNRTHTFTTPLFAHDPFSSFFTDPFTLFNSIFDEMPLHSSGPRVHVHSSSPFRASRFSNFDRIEDEIEGFMESIDRDPFSMGSMPRFTPRTRVSTSLNENGGGRWVSDSFMSTTVNGVTQTIRKQKDSNVSVKPWTQFIKLYWIWCFLGQGNEHITRTLPDGRKILTINGVEQSARGHIAFTDDSKNTPFSPSSENRYLSQPPVASSSRMDYGLHPPPPSYTSPLPSNYHENICKSFKTQPSVAAFI